MCVPHSNDFQHALARAFSIGGLKAFPFFPFSVNNLFRGIHSLKGTKNLNISRSHYCLEGEQREILLGVFTHFCRSSKRALCRNCPISLGRNGRLEQGKLQNLI